MVYDEGANLTKMQGHTTLAYSYDATGRVVKKQNQTEQKETSYTYSPSGALLEATSTSSVTDTSTPSTSSGTDLVAEQSRSTVTQFSYNAAGNQTQNEQTYNTLNQLLEDRDYLYAYDKRGNLQEKLHKQTQTRSIYVFNLFDQLEKVKTVDKDKKLIEGFKFSYDALNRRVSKTTYTSTHFDKLSDQSSAQVPSSTHHYLYDNEDIVAILDENKTLLATIIHDANTDTPLSITTHQNEAKPLDEYEKHKLYTNLSEEEKLHIYQGRQKRTYYYHRDHQGSITALTDDEGNIVETFLYDEAYGTILDHHKIEETYNPYCYTGREFDSKELYYYRARYYDPSIGRFISSDPIEFLSGDFNFYRYVGGDPVNWVDPSGLAGAIAFALPAEVGVGECVAAAVVAFFTPEMLVAAGIMAIGGGLVYGGVTGGGAGDVVRNPGGDIIWTPDTGGTRPVTQTPTLSQSAPVCKAETEVDTDVDTGIIIKGQLRKCGDKKPYKDQNPDSVKGDKRKDRPKHKQNDADHMPSKADVKKDMKAKYKGKVKKSLLDCMEGEVEGLLESLVIPKDVHDAKTATTSPNRKKTKAERDAFREKNGRDRTLSEQSKHEAETIEDEVDKNDKITDECKDAIKKALEFFKNLTEEYFDDIYKDALKLCKNK